MAEVDDWVSPDAAPDQYLQAMRQKYPWTAGVDVNLVNSTAKGDKSRKLEFYPADESDNPRPGKPTIEVFDPSMQAADLMGEILSHHLPKADPVIADFRAQILRQMTPQQIESIRGDYENEKRAGLVDQGDDLKAWIGKQGGDSFFRGYPTGQWSADEYTPEQKATYEKMQDYLTSKFGKGPKGLINTPPPGKQ